MNNWKRMNETEKFLLATQLMELLEKYNVESSQMKQKISEMEVEATLKEMEVEMVHTSIKKYWNLYTTECEEFSNFRREISSILQDANTPSHIKQKLAASLSTHFGTYKN